MQKPLNTPLLGDLPENWAVGDIVSPTGTDVGLTAKHGYNYLGKAVNEAHRAINLINTAFEGVQGDISKVATVTTVVDADAIPTVLAADSTVKRITLANLVAVIRTKFAQTFAAAVHTHGNMTSDGKVGSTAGQAVMTTNGGTIIAGTLPVTGGGTGASTAAAALSNLGGVPTTRTVNNKALSTNISLTAADVGAAPTTHNHNASDINAGTLNADRLPTVPISKGGTGVTDLVITKLKRGVASDTLTQVYLSPSGNDSADGLTASAPMKTIRAAVGKYGGLNRVQLNLASGTYSDTSEVIISGNTYVNIASAATTASAVIITHPIIFQSCDAKLYRITFDLSSSTLTYPGVTFRQSKYDIQECAFKGKPTVHAGINASLGSAGYIVSSAFQAGIRGVEIGAGASMTALTCSIAAGYEIGFNVNGGMLISGGNTNNATTKFTMYNSAVIFNDGLLLNQAANTVATANVE